MAGQIHKFFALYFDAGFAIAGDDYEIPARKADAQIDVAGMARGGLIQDLLRLKNHQRLFASRR